MTSPMELPIKQKTISVQISSGTGWVTIPWTDVGIEKDRIISIVAREGGQPIAYRFHDNNILLFRLDTTGGTTVIVYKEAQNLSLTIWYI